jgi:PIN domain nuclease of toxin-antitoxin system
MSYILDTHILLWARLEPKRIRPKQRIILESSDVEKWISSITVWEISLKYSLGKLDLGGHTPDEFIAGIYKLGMKVIAPNTEQYSTYYLLPKIPSHKDPFDRMLVWHAMKSGATLLSSDNRLNEYEPHGLTIVS